MNLNRYLMIDSFLKLDYRLCFNYSFWEENNKANGTKLNNSKGEIVFIDDSGFYCAIEYNICHRLFESGPANLCRCKNNDFHFRFKELAIEHRTPHYNVKYCVEFAYEAKYKKLTYWGCQIGKMVVPPIVFWAKIPKSKKEAITKYIKENYNLDFKDWVMCF